MDAGVKLGIAGALVAFVIGMSFALGDKPLYAQGKGEGPSNVLRMGYFPNINHAPAVIGIGNGDYQRALGDVAIERQLFTAGPAAVEALIAEKIDCAYVGPNPAITGFLRSGESIKTIAGVSSGGAVFVVRNGAGINSPSDFTGKTLSSPGLGNTQDVALRLYLAQHGYDVKVTGGDPAIQPAKPADILTAMTKGDIDGAWVAEPWGARLVREADARIFLDERDLWEGGRFATSLIICREDYIGANRQTVENLLDAHVSMMLWINGNKDEAVRQFNAEIDELLGAPFDERDLHVALSRMEFTYDPLRETVEKSAGAAYRLGLLGNDGKPDLSGMFELDMLNDVLERKGLDAI